MEGLELYQALEASYVIRGIFAADAMNFFTMFSAYLVASYLVGGKLTTFQISAATLLYSVFSAGPIVGVYAAATDLKSITVGARAAQIDYPLLVPTIMVLAWALSIAFMLDIRRKGQRSGGSG